MTRSRRIILLALLAVVLVMAGGAAFVTVRLWLRSDRATPAELRAQIAALETERETLLARRAELLATDARLRNMPDNRVRVGIPTELARALIEKVIAGFTDRVTVDLRNIRVAKTGTIKKVVTLGTYNLAVTIHRVTARLRAGTPKTRFGSNTVAFDLPVTIAAGAGRATLNFTWDGRNIAGATCGDLDVTQEVRGTVKPGTYLLSGALALTATTTHVIVTPRLRPMKINLRFEPSDQDWAAARKILDDKSGICGMVLDHVDVLGAVRTIIDRGFNVRVPTERIKPEVLPVSVEPSVDVRGRRVKLAIAVGGISITEHGIWMGADVLVPGKAGLLPA
jgi:hypothetical protein